LKTIIGKWLANGAANRDWARRQRNKPGAIEGADRRDQAQIRRNGDGAFESGERLANAVAIIRKRELLTPLMVHQ